jgi:2-polyprenyl-3-methyl-5-hydroxy-6-metoxy-1,4-benzoquinol methylase
MEYLEHTEDVPTRPHSCVVCGQHEHAVVARGTDYQYRTTFRTFDWCRCDACGHFYINPLPTEAALGQIYPKHLKNYSEFDSRPGLAFRVKAFLEGRRLRQLTRNVSEDGRLLDVGCAAGAFLDVVRRECPNIRVLEGLEISESAAVVAKRKGYRVQIATVDDAKLESEFYDVICLQQVIEHVHDPRAVLCKLRKSLKPGGLLILETPNLHSWDHWVFRHGYWEGYHIPRHFNLWTVDGMKRILREAGYAAVTYRKRIKPVHWTISVQNWAIATSQPKAVVDCFDLRSLLPLMFFGAVDVLQLGLQGKASDIQYVATK